MYYYIIIIHYISTYFTYTSMFHNYTLQNCDSIPTNFIKYNLLYSFILCTVCNINIQDILYTIDQLITDFAIILVGLRWVDTMVIKRNMPISLLKSMLQAKLAKRENDY